MRMAKANATVFLPNMVRVDIKVTGIQEMRLRIWLGGLLIKLAARLMGGIGKIEVTGAAPMPITPTRTLPGTAYPVESEQPACEHLRSKFVAELPSTDVRRERRYCLDCDSVFTVRTSTPVSANGDA